MTTRLLLNRRRYFLAICVATILVFACSVHAEERPQPKKPSTEGRPVSLVAGRVVVFPKGVEKPPAQYKGSIGQTPLAVVKLKGKIVGEIYAARLKGKSAEEAKGMAASADMSEKIELKRRARIKDDDDDVEVVTLKMKLNSRVGTPWMFHSLYFPQGNSCVTFKLVASEKEFEKVLPYFETMLLINHDRDNHDKDNSKSGK